MKTFKLIVSQINTEISNTQLVGILKHIDHKVTIDRPTDPLSNTLLSFAVCHFSHPRLAALAATLLHDQALAARRLVASMQLDGNAEHILLEEEIKKLGDLVTAQIRQVEDDWKRQSIHRDLGTKRGHEVLILDDQPLQDRAAKRVALPTEDSRQRTFVKYPCVLALIDSLPQTVDEALHMDIDWKFIDKHDVIKRRIQPWLMDKVGTQTATQIISHIRTRLTSNQLEKIGDDVVARTLQMIGFEERRLKFLYPTEQ